MASGFILVCFEGMLLNMITKQSAFIFLQGHYRFCEALFLLGEHQRALEANAKAQDLCRDNPDGILDLCQQNERFRTEMEKLQGE